MRTKICFVIAFALFVQIVSAQTVGIKGGINFANMSFSNDGFGVSPKSIVGFHFGPVVDFQLQENLRLNTGLLYSLKGFKMEVEGESGTMKFNYLEIPINFAYKFPVSETSNFFIQAGPYFGYALSGKEEGGGESNDIEFGKDQWKRLDLGLGFGAGLEFGSIITSLNYQLGLANLADDPDVTVKNKVLQISLAYMFGAKK